MEKEQSRRMVFYTNPLTDEQLKEFEHRLVDLDMKFGEWARSKIMEEIGEAK